MVSALALDQISKAYQVVKKRQAPFTARSPHLQGLTRLLLGETFSTLGSREVTTIPALDNISFTVEPGQVVGLFGKNGSGKTTLLSILGGVFPADSGSVHCFGHDMRTDLATVRNYIVPIFGWLDAITWAFTGRQNIEKFLLMHHVEPGPLAGQIEELARAIELDERLDDRAARYSQGMRIKLQVIAAILLQRVYGQSLLLLDEPFIGLDLFSQRYLRHFVREELRSDNFSMLLATHQPDDIEALCDEVIVLDRGRVLVKDSVVNLRRRVRQRESLQLVYALDEQVNLPLIPHLPATEAVHTTRRGGMVESRFIVEEIGTTLALLLPALLQANCHLVSIQTKPLTFGDLLIELVTASTTAAAQINPSF